MKRALLFAAAGEAGMGLALLIVPSLVGRLLLGEELTGIATPVARVAGIALIALAVACWPGPPGPVCSSTAPPLPSILPTSASQAVWPAFSCGRPSSCTWS
jgi:hypothetical protein